MLTSSDKFGPILGAIVGSFPGCGGALFVTGLYKKEKVPFSTLAATFIATFSDTSFLILTQRPDIYLWLTLISFVTAVIVGYVLKIEKVNNLIQKNTTTKQTVKKDQSNKNQMPGFLEV